MTSKSIPAELDAKIRSFLRTAVHHGFNRSLSALEEAEAIDTSLLRPDYKGIGSKYHDLVTDQIEYTVDQTMPALMEELARLNEH